MRILALIGLFSFLTSSGFGQEVNLFFMGNLHKADSITMASVQSLQRECANAKSTDVLVFLGNNIKNPNTELDIQSSENDPQIAMLKNFPGKKVVIPGLVDWGRGKKKGYGAVLSQEKYFENALGESGVFQPQSGCPGPVEIEINEELVLIVMNTQFYLHPWIKPSDADSCPNASTDKALESLQEMIQRNKNRQVVLVGHHPVISYGNHRKGLGIQNLSNPRYTYLRDQMFDIFESSERLIYVSSHDDGMQHIAGEKNHFVVVGSGGEYGKLRAGDYTRFFAKKPGFAQIRVAENEKSELMFWNGLNDSLLYREPLFEPRMEFDPEELKNRPDFKGTTMILAADTNLASKGTSGERLFLGNIYRDEWSVPLEFPTFDIAKEHGGLKITKVGGGGQTRTLRLEAENGEQWVLRSIKKWPVKAVPDMLKNTIAAKLATDQMSDAHPYSAFIVPSLADAIEIYHTNPTVVALPDDPLFGQYREFFTGLLALYEQRPNSKAAHLPNFGSGEKIKSTFDVIDKLREDHDNQIDDKFLIRNRLFDMWLGDWDRHEDQWRWVQKDNPKGSGKLFQPIPRDRDQVFFDTEGFLPWLISRKAVYPIFQGFDNEVKWADALNWQARWFDRSFLNQLEWKDWKKQAEFLQERLTDEEIEKAFAIWPDTIYKLSGDEIKAKLQARRKDIPRFAKEYYKFLAMEVDVLGSDQREYFEIKRIDKKKTDIRVYKVSKNGKKGKVIYKRRFKTKETKEVRLYGFGDDDEFRVTGNVKKGIRVRIIGGAGADVVVDSSKVTGIGRKTVVYDEKKDTKLVKGGETANKLSRDPGINRYDRKAWKANKTFPLVSVNWNRDDGIFIGGGFRHIGHGFRKYPFKVRHTLSGNIAFATLAFNLKYKGEFTDFLGKWDLIINADLRRPYGVSNFFGMGNESTFDTQGVTHPTDHSRPIDYYRVRYEMLETQFELKNDFGKFSQFYFGPRSGSYHLFDQKNRFISQPGNGLDSNRTFRYFHYLGLGVRYELETRDSKVLPTKGWHGEVDFSAWGGLNEWSRNFARLRATLEYTFSVRTPQLLSIANRVGYTEGYGGYEFFNGAVLGRPQIRGLRRGRFYGDRMFFHNIDLRYKLFSFTSIIVPGSMGVLVFHDLGRVWYDQETSFKWHNAYGLGFWLSPLDALSLTATYAFGDDENQLIVRTRFHF